MISDPPVPDPAQTEEASRSLDRLLQEIRRFLKTQDIQPRFMNLPAVQRTGQVFARKTLFLRSPLRRSVLNDYVAVALLMRAVSNRGFVSPVGTSPPFALRAVGSETEVLRLDLFGLSSLRPPSVS